MSINISYESKDREKEEETVSNKIRHANKISVEEKVKPQEKIKTIVIISENYQVFLSVIFFLMGCTFLFYLYSFVFSIYVSI